MGTLACGPRFACYHLQLPLPSCLQRLTGGVARDADIAGMTGAGAAAPGIMLARLQLLFVSPTKDIVEPNRLLRGSCACGAWDGGRTEWFGARWFQMLKIAS